MERVPQEKDEKGVANRGGEMKNVLKIGSVFVGFYIMFAIGCWCSGKIDFWEKEKEIIFLKEQNNARNDYWGEDLTEADAKFLQEHIFGQWQYSKWLSPSNSGSNFTEQGIEEMKEVTISYDENFVTVNGYEMDTFSDANDIACFLWYGGKNEVNLPVYHVERDIDKENVPYLEEYDLVYVHYDLGYDVNYNPSVLYGSGYLANYIYVNPDDKDTLYLNCGGWWELKRIQDNQSDYAIQAITGMLTCIIIGCLFLYKGIHVWIAMNTDVKRKLKKIIKISIISAGACVMAMAGYNYCSKIDSKKKQDEIQAIKERITARDASWGNLMMWQWRSNLTEEEDEKFIEEHVFGTWRFSKRLAALDDGGNGIANFSEQGVEELKNMGIIYDDIRVTKKNLNEYKNCFLSKPGDIFLFTEYGGDKSVRYPTYYIEREVDEERIKLKNISGEEIYIQLPEECELIHVYYDLDYDEENNPSVLGYYLANDLYVNPDDKDTLYLNFCGLWELKRVEEIQNKDE